MGMPTILREITRLSKRMPMASCWRKAVASIVGAAHARAGMCGSEGASRRLLTIAER